MSGVDGGGGKERSRLLSVRYRWSQRRIRMALPERGRFGLVPALPWTEMKEAEPFGQTLLSSSTSTNASTIIVKLPAHQLNSHTPPTTRTFVMKPTPSMFTRCICWESNGYRPSHRLMRFQERDARISSCLWKDSSR